MKTFLTLISCFSLLIGISGCRVKASITINGKKIKEKDMTKVKVDKNYVQPVSNAAFSIEDWSIQGDVAIVPISYSGGCGAHTFKAFFTGNYMKSLPPKVSIFIEHQNGGDKCRKLVMDTLYIYLHPVRYEKDKAGSVIIGFNNSEKTVEYSHN